MPEMLTWPDFGGTEKALDTPEHSAGGKRLLALPEGTQGRAVFGGPRGCYRYALERLWDTALPAVLFVMMNPSTANPIMDDPTVAKCGRFARRWGYGRLLVGNTYAWRSTDQRGLLDAEDPVGPLNNDWLLTMAREASLVVFAFGTPTSKPLLPRGMEVANTLHAQGIIPHALRLTAANRPWHPLYLPDSIMPISWIP